MHCVKHVIIWVLGILAVASACAEDFSPNLQQLNHRGFHPVGGRSHIRDQHCSNHAAREVIAISSGELRRSGVVLETDFAESLPVISGDRVQLLQVILNFLLNAADATAEIGDRPKTLRILRRSMAATTSN